MCYTNSFSVLGTNFLLVNVYDQIREPHESAAAAPAQAVEIDMSNLLECYYLCLSYSSILRRQFSRD
jgi:hypothetical protein